MRATRPRLRLSGRPRHGRMPSVEVAKSLRRRSGRRRFRREVAEDVAPRAVAQHGSAQAALAVAEAFDLPDADALIGGGAAFRQAFAGAGTGIRAGFVATGGADEIVTPRRGRWARRTPAGKYRRLSNHAPARDTRQAVGFRLTAGLLACGSSPLPPSRKSPVAFGRALRLQLRGQLRNWAVALTAFPLSPSRCGEGTVVADLGLAALACQRVVTARPA